MSLPFPILERELPHTGKGFHPIIETDRESLYIRRAFRINEKWYDLRIWRLNEEKRPMRITEKTHFPTHTIIAAQHLAKEIFGNHFDDPTSTRMWYSDVGDHPSCLWENPLLPDDALGKSDNLCISAPNHPLIKQMEQLHHLFFHDTGTIVTTDPAAIITPREISLEEYPPKPKEEPPTSPVRKKRKKSGPLPKHIKEHLPLSLTKNTNGADPVVEPTSGGIDALPKRGKTPSKQPITAEEHLDNLHDAFRVASKTFQTKEGSLFKGISYLDLEKYAQDRNKKQKDELEKIYQAYLRVLRDPKATGDTNAEEMKKWLKHHYKAALKEYEKLEVTWRLNKEGREKFVDWCQYYAAKAIAGFILAEGQSIDALVAELQTTDTATPVKSEGSRLRRLVQKIPFLWK